jgi:hypothetical protein
MFSPEEDQVFPGLLHLLNLPAFMDPLLSIDFFFTKQSYGFPHIARFGC